MELYHRLGWFSSYQSVGTELALFGLRNHTDFAIVDINIRERTGQSKFASTASANLKILLSLSRAIVLDYSSSKNKNSARA